MDSAKMSVSYTLPDIGKRMQKAQFALDSQVMADMTDYMPMQTGTFINTTRARSMALAGTGEVIAASPPMGRFLYYGKVMVGEASGRVWALPGERKVVTDRDLILNRGAHPSAQAQWFEVAKQQHIGEWVALVGKVLEGNDGN